MSWPSATPAPFRSQGHGAGRYTIDVRVEPRARARYLALLPGTEFDAGTLIAALHHDAEQGQPGPIYLMEKVTTGWQFAMVGSDGRTSSIDVELCRRCHAESVADHVFGLPTSARPSLDGG